MPQSEQTHSGAPQNFTSENNSYVVLDAYDSLVLARCSEVYLQALEHYILVNSDISKDQLLHFLRLYRVEANRELNKTADILKAALEQQWEAKGDE